MKTQNNYCRAAANWWATKIIEKETISVKNIDSFQETLAKEIDDTISKSAHMIISTYKTRSKILDSISFQTGMCASIPNGYEMDISHYVGVCVYDKKGVLIASFS